MLNKLFLTAALLFALGCTPSSHDLGRFNPKIKPQPKPTPTSMSQVSYLRKLSLHLRGQTPERSEYLELTKALEKDKSAEFFKNKTAEYLASKQHIDKMSFRLEELFQVRASGTAYYNADIIAETKKNLIFLGTPLDTYTIENSMNELFRRMVAKNASWDTLLVGKNYRAFPPPPTSALSRDLTTGDFLFFSSAAGIPSQSQAEADVNFAADDARVAGTLTTDRFFARNVTTALNKNRKRAAAIFRTFLCDDMKAVIVDESGNQNEILDRIFPANPLPIGGGGGSQRGMPGDIHGSDPACMKCHYKLDPMGRTFADSGMILSPLASPGALVYTRPNGDKVDIPVRGVGELGQAITQQPEYVSCQTGYFWKWFIGADKTITPAIQSELNAKFDEVGRRPNDFIAYLVSRPEFGFTESGESNGQLIAQVKGVLQNCNGCHALETTKKIPSFTTWPMGGNEALHQRWIGGIRKSLSLDGASAPRTMPPKKSSWQPTVDQLAVIQHWLDMGAPNE